MKARKFQHHHHPTREPDFDVSLPDLEPPSDLGTILDGPLAAGAWTRANEARPTIAGQVGVAVATWTTRTRSGKTITRDARRLERAVEAMDRLPDAGEYVHIVTGAEFRGFDLLPAMLKLAKSERFDALTLTTLGFSRDNLGELCAMVEAGRIPPERLRVLCSDFFRRADRGIWQHGAEQARRLGYGFKSCRNHTKIILASIAGNAYVTESSANLRSCANLEQFCITQSKALFDFHTGWIEQVWPTAEN
jgi:hypothetical protein